ncbi:MAG: hypothetical protein GY801_16975 [bacterium]|nr:hypothetical protein [bacterium]
MGKLFRLRSLKNNGSLRLPAIGSAEAQLWRVLAGEASSKSGRHTSGVEHVCLAR